jgi:hypothetical protein
MHTSGKKTFLRNVDNYVGHLES